MPNLLQMFQWFEMHNCWPMGILNLKMYFERSVTHISAHISKDLKITQKRYFLETAPARQDVMIWNLHQFTSTKVLYENDVLTDSWLRSANIPRNSKKNHDNSQNSVILATISPLSPAVNKLANKLFDFHKTSLKRFSWKYFCRHK